MFEMPDIIPITVFYSIYWWVCLVGVVIFSWKWMFPKSTHRLYYVGGCLLCVPKNATYPIIYKREIK